VWGGGIRYSRDSADEENIIMKKVGVEEIGKDPENREEKGTFTKHFTDDKKHFSNLSFQLR
jgi:hypothetical protein